MSERNFREELLIDQHRLDKCAVAQPDLFAEWACQWADAVNDRDRAKDALSLARANADYDVRSKPQTFGWVAEKAPTEAFISSAILTHEDYKAANEIYMTTCHSVNVLSIAKEAFEQRRKMIEVLANLYMSSYFSGNKDLDKSYQPAQDAVSAEEQNNGLAASTRLRKRSQ